MRFWCVLGVWGVRPGRSGAPAWQIPGGRTSPIFTNTRFWQEGPPGCLFEGATPPIFPKIPAFRLGPGTFWAGPRGRPCQPALLSATLTGCERRSVCWEPLLLVERPAQAARTHNPTVIHFSSVLLWYEHFLQSCEGKQRARKPPLLEGGFGG